MNFPGPGPSEHGRQGGHGGAPDEGVVHQHDPFAADRRLQHAQFHLDGALALLGGGFDEGAAHVAVFVEGYGEGDAGFLGKAGGGGQAGVGDTDHQVGLCGAGSGQGGPAF